MTAGAETYPAIAEDQQPERVAVCEARKHPRGVPGGYFRSVLGEQPREGGGQLPVVRCDEDPRLEPISEGHLWECFAPQLYIRACRKPV